ncbi:diguanylate cyclase activity [Vibrio sp. B1ASS3]|uniref:diguanylate cyclase n=1 Tax=Vibrio sp. B1ASS3 TaxID=2751176 RepID=UPI001ABB2E29|nr:diguanylate cyclase [Vibrio sp. B1ASS3]CAD7809053.1 diguanylate cyclase activity [Vibrio sp. B1ASS3]CAE6908535.1 diguanylate cyclase activity [Vibrio sp. B1ASS3]
MNVSRSLQSVTLRYTVPIVLIALFTNFTYWAYQQVDEAKNLARYHVKSAELNLGTIVDGYRDLLRAMSKDEHFVESDITLQERAQRAVPYKQAFELAGIGFSDGVGNMVSTHNNKVHSIAHRNYFHQVIRTKETVMTNVLTDVSNGKTVYVLCRPMFDENGDLQGTISASIHFSEIQMALDTDGESDIYSVLLDEDLNIISHSVDEHYIGVNLFNYGYEKLFDREGNLKALTGTDSGGFFTYSYPLDLSYVEFTKVEGTPWILLSKAKFSTLLGDGTLMFGANVMLIIAIYVVIARLMGKQVVGLTQPLDRFLEESKVVFNDSSMELKEHFEQVLQASRNGVFCSRSGLLTREYFLRGAEKSLSLSNTPKACIFFDMDNLKYINDTYGHLAGDKVIALFVAVLRESFGHKRDIIGRFGGDEFVVLTQEFRTKRELELKLDKFLAKLQSTADRLGIDISLTASIGVVLTEGVGRDIDILLHCSDMAVYRAKQLGKGRYAFYHTSMVEVPIFS